MSQEQVQILQRALKREKAARKAAESILEEKSRELYFTSQRLEQLLDEKSSQLQGVFENIVDAYVVMDLQGNFIKFNEAATKLFGYDISREKVNVVKLIYKEDYPYAIASFTQLQTKGYFKNYEARVYTKSKEVKWVHINASVIFDKDKNPVAAQGIVRDITDQKESEEKLIASENRLASLIVNLDSGIVLEDENRNIVLTNNKFCELFNIEAKPSDLIGMDCKAASEKNKVLFKNPESFLQRIRAIDAAKKVVIGDDLEMVDGKILERNYIPIIIGGSNKGYLWTFKDVTLNRTYRKSLEVQKQKYYNIIANMHLGLIEVDTKGKILMVNQSFSEMSGYSMQELSGKLSKEVFPIDKKSSEIIKDENIKRNKGEANSYEIQIKNKNGEEKYWLVSAAPNINIEGVQTGSIGVTLDITDFKNLELQKEKLLSKLEKSNDELQEYAHIVSHDLKSPLRSIHALVSWLKEDNQGKLDDVSIQNIGLIETTLEKMEQLITDVLNYSSVGAETSLKTEVDLNSLVNELVSILYIPEHIQIKSLHALPNINGDRTKLQQLFQNLISNAVKFIDKEQGSIIIDVEDLKSHYKFSIQDNGIGIEKKYHDKIFKIFHSLKKSKDSSGIGLSIVKKIVNLHEGEIWLDSKPNIGTTFYFTLKK
ncbi:PAS domain S-box protein [Lacinutrix sp. C3R15]|uniref:PAS domain-containing sensor histidine kinase n=1 Tax=Flavobacteriaceae TaxID=49546 RepID=UPI001C09AD18|nr:MULTISPECIES: PAS domain S-box protein [Flavobacteriaceae]MBU2938168.1 PAS domain S-box protein [Lacinutrix sp. C3R15]MDO6621482.1 PAS domain S-box protein [Oceanihabitans sp. 1_MG-2023]